MADSRDFKERDYEEAKKDLTAKELKEIERLEKNCADLTIDYWDFYKDVEGYKVGVHWTVEKLLRLRVSPIYKMKAHLLLRAMRLRHMRLNE